MQSLDERLAELRRELKEHQDRAQDEAEWSERIAARIAGIEEAREALAAMAALDVPLDIRPRSQRRDIKALVRAARRAGLETADSIATSIDCRPSQVRRALEVLRKDAEQ